MYILFDIGGTKMRIAGSRDLGSFVDEPFVVETPKNFEEGIKVLSEKIALIATGDEIKGIAGGIAGPIDQTEKILIAGPNVSGWVGKPLVSELRKRFDVPVYLENDTALVGLGEMHHGAGSVEGVVSYITVSTGVGGARYEDGVIDRRSIGFEPGHQIIDAGKGLCPDCKDGTLESHIGGAATEARTHQKAYDIHNEAFWDEYAKWLAYGLNNVAVFWSPQIIVLGGSMIIGDPSIPLEYTKECLKGMLKIFPEVPEIRKATLGDLGGLYGAMVLMKQEQK